MNILLAICSKGRPDVLVSHALSWVPQTGLHFRIFVEPNQELAYYECLKPLGLDNALFILTDNDIGLQGALNQVASYAEYYACDWILKVDDDVKGFCRQSKKETQVADDFKTLTANVQRAVAKDPSIVAVGFPYHHEMFTNRTFTGVNARLQTCYMCKSEYIEGPVLRPWEIDVFEDFYRYLRILTERKKTIRYGRLGIDCRPVGSGSGGHNELLKGKTRRERAVIALERLQDLCPDLAIKQVKGKDWDYEPDFRKTPSIGGRSLV